MGGEQLRGEGKRRTVSGETYDPAKPNTEGPGARGMNLEELKRKLARDSEERAAQVVAATNAAQTAADAAEAVRNDTRVEIEAMKASQQGREAKAEQPVPGINQPLYMLVALGLVVVGIVVLSLNGLQNSTATITLGALATTLGGAIAGVTIPQALKR